MTMIKFKVVEEIVVNRQTIKEYELKKIFDTKTFKPKQMPDIYKHEYPGPWYVLGYRIMAGLSIFYITPPVYEAGVSEGIIEPIRWKPDGVETVVGPYCFCEEELYGRMLQNRSHVIVNSRIHDALKKTTIPFLKSELEKVNKSPKTITVKVYTTYNWWERGKKVENPSLKYSHKVVVDLEHRKLLENTVGDKRNNWDIGFFLTCTYGEFIAELAKLIDCEFMNCENLYEEYKKYNFFRKDYPHEYEEKYEFIFE